MCRRIMVLSLALLAPVILCGCPDDVDQDVGDGRQPYVIEGLVELQGVGLPGIAVSFSGTDAPAPCATAGALGAFSQGGFAAGTFTVTPSDATYDFYVDNPAFVTTADLATSAAVVAVEPPVPVTFNAVPAGSVIDLWNPNGGESFLIGETVNVTWKSTVPVANTVRLDWWGNDSAWHEIATAIPNPAAPTGNSYAWYIDPTHPEIATIDWNQVRVRITSEDYPEVLKDQSDGTFTVGSSCSLAGYAESGGGSPITGVQFQFIPKPATGSPDPPTMATVDLIRATADSGTATTLVDASIEADQMLVAAPVTFTGLSLLVVEGTNQFESDAIATFTQATGTFTFGAGFSSPVDNTTVYEIPCGRFLQHGWKPGTYIITPQKAGFTFAPASQEITINSGDSFRQLAAPFVGSPSGGNLTLLRPDANEVLVVGTPYKIRWEQTALDGTQIQVEWDEGTGTWGDLPVSPVDASLREVMWTPTQAATNAIVRITSLVDGSLQDETVSPGFTVVYHQTISGNVVDAITGAGEGDVLVSFAGGNDPPSVKTNTGAPIGDYTRDAVEPAAYTVTANKTGMEFGAVYTSGTASGGTTTTLVDAGHAGYDAGVIGRYVTFLSGLNQGQSRLITAWGGGPDLTWVEPLANAVAASDVYAIHQVGTSAASVTVTQGADVTGVDFLAFPAGADVQLNNPATAGGPLGPWYLGQQQELSATTLNLTGMNLAFEYKIGPAGTWVPIGSTPITGVITTYLWTVDIGSEEIPCLTADSREIYIRARVEEFSLYQDVSTSIHVDGGYRLIGFVTTNGTLLGALSGVTMQFLGEEAPANVTTGVFGFYAAGAFTPNKTYTATPSLTDWKFGSADQDDTARETDDFNTQASFTTDSADIVGDASALSGDFVTLVDADSALLALFPNNSINEGILEITSGPESGEKRRITGYVQATGVITFDPALSSAITAGTTYQILVKVESFFGAPSTYLFTAGGAAGEPVTPSAYPKLAWLYTKDYTGGVTWTAEGTGPAALTLDGRTVEMQFSNNGGADWESTPIQTPSGSDPVVSVVGAGPTANAADVRIGNSAPFLVPTNLGQVRVVCQEYRLIRTSFSGPITVPKVTAYLFKVVQSQDLSPVEDYKIALETLIATATDVYQPTIPPTNADGKTGVLLMDGFYNFKPLDDPVRNLAATQSSDSEYKFPARYLYKSVSNTSNVTILPRIRFMVQPRAWPQFGFNDSRTSQAGYAGTRDHGARWDFTNLDDKPAGPAAVDADGSTYFVTRDQFLYALDRSGQQRWRAYLEDPGSYPDDFPYTPQIALDGSVLIYNNGYLEAIDPEDGATRWSVYGNETQLPLVARNGCIYMSYEESSLSFGFAARNIDGTDAWRRHFNYSSPDVNAETPTGVEAGNELTTLVDSDIVWPSDLPTDSAAWDGGLLVVEKGTKSYLRYITGFDNATKTFHFEPAIGTVVGTVTDNLSDYGKPPWRANWWTQVGDRIAAVGFVFECTASVATMQTGAAPPPWDTTIGNPTVDVDVTWTCMNAVDNSSFYDANQIAGVDLNNGDSGNLIFTTGKYFGQTVPFTDFQNGVFTLGGGPWPELMGGDTSDSEDADSYLVERLADQVQPTDTYTAFTSFFQGCGTPLWGPQDLVYIMRRMDMPLAGLFSDFSEARFRRTKLSGVDPDTGHAVVDIILPDAIGQAESYSWSGVPMVAMGDDLYFGYPYFDGAALDEYRWHLLGFNIDAAYSVTPLYDVIADDDDGIDHTCFLERGRTMAYSPMNGGTLVWPGRSNGLGGFLRGFDIATGGVSWTFPLSNIYWDWSEPFSPAADNQGNVYVSTWDRRLYRIEPSGPWSDYTPWAPSTAYVVGDEVVPPGGNGYIYRCTIDGTSGAGQPAWTTTVGDTFGGPGPLPFWVCSAKTDNAKVADGWPYIKGVGGDVSGAPVMGPDGTVYIGGTGDGALDYYFRAVTDIGTARWATSFPAEWLVSLDMHKEGGNEYVYGLGDQGRIEKWDVANEVFLGGVWPLVPGGTMWGITGVSNQQIALATYGANQYVHIIDNGGRLWYVKSDGTTNALPRYEPDVSKNWSKSWGGPAIDSSDNLYMAVELSNSPWGGRVFKLAPSALPGESAYNLTWGAEGGPYFDKWGSTAWFQGTPVVDDGTGFIYVTTNDDIYAIDGTDGTLLWGAYGISPGEIRPALDNAAGFRRIYVRGSDSLYVYDSYTGQLQYTQTVGGDWAFGERQQVIVSTEPATLTSVSDAAGAADGTTLVDTGAAGSFAGQMMWITSAPANLAGLVGQSRMINAFNGATGTFTVDTPFGFMGHLGVKGRFVPLDAGVLTGPPGPVNTTVVEDATKLWPVDQFAGETILFRSGPSAGEDADILSNTATTITMQWSREVEPGMIYEIVESEHDAFTDRTRVEPDDFFNNWEIYIYTGTNTGDSAQIADYTGATGTFWTAGGGDESDSSSRYSISPTSGLVFYDDDLPWTTKGLATGGNTTTVVDASRTEPDGFFDGWQLVITTGLDRGEEHSINTYASKTFNLDTALSNGASAGDTYLVYRPIGQVDYTGKTMVFLTGGNAGESRTITAYDPDGGRGQITIDTPLPSSVTPHLERFIIPVQMPSGIGYTVMPQTVYVTAGKDLVAMAPAVNGVVKWRATLDSDFSSKPAFIYDADPFLGRMFALSRDGLLNALDLTGAALWATDTGGSNNLGFAPMVGDNDVIIGNDNNVIAGYRK